MNTKKYHILVEYIMVFAVAILLTVVFLSPAIPHVTTMFIGDGGDNYEYASYMGLAARSIQQGIMPLAHTDFWRYPVGIDFGRSFDSYITLSIGTILTILFSPPLSYNITILLLLTINGILSFLYFRFITKSFLLGILGMIIYGFSFYVLAKADAHPNLLVIGIFPFVLYTFLRLCLKANPKFTDFLLFFLASLLSGLASMQYAVILFLFFILFTGVSSLFYRREFVVVLNKIIQSKKESLKALLITIVLFLVLFSPQIIALFSGTFQFSDRSGTLYAATPGIDNIIRPNAYLDLIISKFTTSSTRPSIESVTFLGWIELAGFALFLTSNKISTRFKAFLAFLFFIPFLLSLGYGKENSFPLLPYRFLSHIPIFAVIAETGRYFTIFYLVVTTAIVLYLSTIQKKRRRYALILLILVGVFFERLPNSVHIVPTMADDAYIPVVANTNSQAVLDLPINLYTPRYNMLSLYYQKPIVNGYFHWSADGKKERSFLDTNLLLARYTCSDVDPMLTHGMDSNLEQIEDEKLFKTLKEHGITTIVIHKDDKFYHTICRNVRMRLARINPYVNELSETHDQVEVKAKSWDSKPSFTFFFPKDGMFYLDGLYVAPNVTAKFTITKNNIPVPFYYEWAPVGSPHAFEIKPRDTFQLPVTAGTTYTFSSQDEVGNTYLSLWYRYIPNKDSTTVFHYKPPVKKLYEDDEAIVYELQ